MGQMNKAELTPLQEMLERFRTYKKKELEYMLAGAIHKLEIARRALAIIDEYELEPMDKQLVEAAIKEVLK